MYTGVVLAGPTRPNLCNLVTVQGRFCTSLQVLVIITAVNEKVELPDQAETNEILLFVRRVSLAPKHFKVNISALLSGL